MPQEAFKKAFRELKEKEALELYEKSNDLIYQDGSVLIHEGEDHAQVMVILDGEIRVVGKGLDGKEAELCEPIGFGASIGEMSFIDHMGASASLIAKGDVVVKAVTHEIIQEMTQQDPTFLERFYHSLLFTVIGRLRELDYKMTL